MRVLGVINYAIIDHFDLDYLRHLREIIDENDAISEPIKNIIFLVLT